MPKPAELILVREDGQATAPQNAADPTKTVYVSEFNPSLGVLDGATLFFSVRLGYQSSISEITGSDIDYFVNANIEEFSLSPSTGPDFETMVETEFTVMGPILPVPALEPFAVYNFFSTVDFGSVALADPQDLVGTGTFQTEAVLEGFFTPGVIADINSVLIAAFSAKVAVIYEYGPNVISSANSAGDKYDNYVDLGAGDDIYNGKNGDDIIIGGEGDDIIRGSGGFDQASYSTSDAGVKVDLTKSGKDVGGGQGADTFVSIEGLRGSKFGDTLLGDGADNLIVGLSGDDVLKGRGGDDEIRGDAGNDTLFGNGQKDVLEGMSGDDDLRGGSGGDTLFGGTGSDVLKGGSDADFLSGGGAADTLLGNSGKDVLFGDAGDDTLNGGQSADQIYGGRGDDTMIGGSGADTFVIVTGDDDDVITDFELDKDILDLTGTDFTGVTQSETSAGYLIEFADGSSILLEGLSSSDYHDVTVLLPDA